MKKTNLLGIFALFILLLNACEGNKVQDNIGRFRLINASYLSNGINVDIDYKTVYDKYVEYLNYSLFRDLMAGKSHKLQIRDGSGTVIIDTALLVEENKAYTLFVYDSMNTIKHKVVEEVFAVPKGSNCKVRFLHLSNNAPIVDLKRSNFTSPEFQHYENGMNSDYQIFESGNYFYEVMGAGTSSVLYAQQPYAFKAGYFYTMYLKGNAGSAGTDSLGLFIVENTGEY